MVEKPLAAGLRETGVEIRECTTVEELSGCVSLQREVFGLPEVEISPVRHFVVTMHAGGFTLGAFKSDRLVGFVLSVPAFVAGARAFYSHMAAVASDFQGVGLGAALKWAQRERAIAEGVTYVKWTFQPVHARNAFFNLEKLGHHPFIWLIFPQNVTKLLFSVAKKVLIFPQRVVCIKSNYFYFL